MISQGGDITSYIKDSINHFNEINKINPNVTSSAFLQTLGSKLNSEYTFEDLENICTLRILGISFIHSEKIKLQQVTNKLLKYKEKAIQDILI